MKYMHNIPESYKEIILLAIISHLTESLMAHSTIHQAQTYPSEYVCIASLKKKSKKESWEQPRAQHIATLTSWTHRGLPGDLQTLLQQDLPSTTAAIQNCLPAPEPPGLQSFPQLPQPPGDSLQTQLWAELPSLAVWRGSRFCIGSLLIPTCTLLYLGSQGNQIFNILNKSAPS